MKRITFKDSLSDFWAQVIGFDGMFFRTLRDLTVCPGVVARDYVRGIRVRYFGPIGYFFFMITLLLLWLSILNLNFAELIRSRHDALDLVERNQRSIALVTQWMGDHIKWVLFLAVPFQAFAARYLFFRKSQWNFTEHTVPLFYATGHLFWIMMLTFAYRKVTGDLPAVYITTFLYFGFMYSNLITYQSRTKAFLKGMGVYISGQVLFTLVAVILVIAVILVLALVNPGALDSFKPSAK